MAAYYNEIDHYAAQWLRNLITAGHIASGEVDERSIIDVQPADLRGFTQCHFFAGIGVWSHALRLAGWPDDRPVWTGSCPCQPFSSAGKGDEFADERHLWPAWFQLIRECRPVAVFGEQVASRDALAWLDHVCADLEGEGYAVGAVDTCAAGYGAPHIRQRLYWCGSLAYTEVERQRSVQSGRHSGRGIVMAGSEPWRDGGNGSPTDGVADRFDFIPSADGQSLVMGDTASGGLGVGGDAPQPGSGGYADGASIVGDTIDAGSQGQQQSSDMELHRGTGADGSTPTAGFWRDAIWLPCRDGKARPTESGTFPLAHGATQRVGRLRAYGNCIVAPQAACFVEACATTISSAAGSSPQAQPSNP